MASILKVDQIQLPDGSAPTASDLGVDVSGTVLQVTSQNQASNTAITSTTMVDVGMNPISITTLRDNSTIQFNLSGGRGVIDTGTNNDGIAYQIMYSLNGGAWTVVPSVAASTINCFHYVNGASSNHYGLSMAYGHSPSASAGDTISYKVYARSWLGASCRPFANDTAGGLYNVSLTEIAQ